MIAMCTYQVLCINLANLPDKNWKKRKKQALFIQTIVTEVWIKVKTLSS